MNQYLKIDPWCIVEEGFRKENHKSSESIFSLGNGRFGQRANFEEHYSGESLLGNYIAGVYYPDKTRVGWWKNGYPEYFAKVLNAPNWLGINIRIDEEEVDLGKCKVLSFIRKLNMKEGTLYREYHVALSKGKEVKASVTRFLSMHNPEIGAIRYELTPVNFSGEITITSYLDAGIKNADANYDEYFWDVILKDISGDRGYIVSRTRKTEFEVCVGIATSITTYDGKSVAVFRNNENEKYIASVFKVDACKNKSMRILKYASVLSSLYHEKKQIRKTLKLF
jgi:maltose phosphorylase